VACARCIQSGVRLWVLTVPLSTALISKLVKLACFLGATASNDAIGFLGHSCESIQRNNLRQFQDVKELSVVPQD
jgi:hypothetical protein